MRERRGLPETNAGLRIRMVWRISSRDSGRRCRQQSHRTDIRSPSGTTRLLAARRTVTNPPATAPSRNIRQTVSIVLAPPRGLGSVVDINCSTARSRFPVTVTETYSNTLLCTVPFVQLFVLFTATEPIARLVGDSTSTVLPAARTRRWTSSSSRSVRAAAVRRRHLRPRLLQLRRRAPRRSRPDVPRVPPGSASGRLAGAADEQPVEPVHGGRPSDAAAAASAGQTRRRRRGRRDVFPARYRANTPAALEAATRAAGFTSGSVAYVGRLIATAPGFPAPRRRCAGPNEHSPSSAGRRSSPPTGRPR